MVVHVSHTYGTRSTGGADAAATRRHREMLAAGEKSVFLCVDVDRFDVVGDDVVVMPRTPWRRRIYRFMAWRLVRYAMRVLNLPMDTNLGIVPVGLKGELCRLKPDRVYLHWLGGEMLRYEELAGIECPVTIVLHDFSLLNGVKCGSDARTGASVGTRLDRWLFWRKKKSLADLDLAFEVPSEWAAKVCRTSEIGRGKNVVVRRGNVDHAFAPQGESTVRDDGTYRILFGCRNGRKNPAKGFRELAQAIALLPQSLKDRCELRIFGEESAPCETSGVKTVFLGDVNNPADLAGIYNTSDVLAFPSVSETQGLVKDEALACGLKVVTFNRTACPEGISHKVNGYIAKDVSDFAEGLKWALNLA